MTAHYEYLNLNDVSKVKRCNAIAVVRYLRSPAKTRGTSYCLQASLTDPSLCGGKMTCLFFDDELESLPQLTTPGDIIVAHRLEIQSVNGVNKAVGCRSRGFAAVVFASHLDQACPVEMTPRASRRSCRYGVYELQKVKQLREWAKSSACHLEMETAAQSPYPSLYMDQQDLSFGSSIVGEFQGVEQSPTLVQEQELLDTLHHPKSISQPDTQSSGIRGMEFQPPIHQEERGKFCINSHVDKEVIGLNKTQTGQSSYQLEQQKAKTSVSHCHLEHSGQVDLGPEPRYRFEKFQSQKLGNCLESCDGEYQPQQWQQDHSQIGEQLIQYNPQPLVPHQLCSNCAKHQGSLLPQQKPQNHIIPHLSNTRIPDDRSRWRRTSSTSAPSLQVHNSTREHSSLPPSESVHKSLSLRRLTDWLPNEYGNVEGQVVAIYPFPPPSICVLVYLWDGVPMKQPEVSATETALTGHTRRHLVPLQFIGPLSSSLASQTSLSGTQFSAELVAVTAHFPWSALTDSPCPGCFRPNETAYSRLGSASDVGMAPGGRRPLDWSIPVFLFDEHASWALDHVAPGDILRLINVRCCQRSRSQSYCSHASLSQPFGCPLPLRVQLVLHGNGQAYGRRGVIVCTGAQLNSHLAAGCSSNPLNFKTLVSHRSNNVTSDTLKRDSTKKISAESMPIAGTCSTTVVKSGAAGSAPTTRISSSRLGVAPAIQSSVHARHASLGVCEGCILLRSVNAYGLLDRLLEGTRERRRIARPLSIRSGDVFRQPIMPLPSIRHLIYLRSFDESCLSMASCWMDIVDDLSDSKDPHSFSSDSHSKVQEASNYPSFSGSENSANPTASEQQCPDVKSLAFASPSISATTLVTYQPSLKGNRQVGKTFASSKCLDSSLECSHQSKRRKYQPCLQSKASSLDLCPEFASSSNNADGLACREERIVTRTASSLQPIEWSRLPSASSDWHPGFKVRMQARVIAVYPNKLSHFDYFFMEKCRSCQVFYFPKSENSSREYLCQNCYTTSPTAPHATHSDVATPLLPTGPSSKTLADDGDASTFGPPIVSSSPTSHFKSVYPVVWLCLSDSTGRLTVQAEGLPVLHLLEAAVRQSTLIAGSVVPATPATISIPPVSPPKQLLVDKSSHGVSLETIEEEGSHKNENRNETERAYDDLAVPELLLLAKRLDSRPSSFTENIDYTDSIEQSPSIAARRHLLTRLHTYVGQWIDAVLAVSWPIDKEHSECRTTQDNIGCNNTEVDLDASDRGTIGTNADNGPSASRIAQLEATVHKKIRQEDESYTYLETSLKHQSELAPDTSAKPHREFSRSMFRGPSCKLLEVGML